MYELSKEMKNTLEKLLIQALHESKREAGNCNVEKYPSQVYKRMIEFF